METYLSSNLTDTRFGVGKVFLGRIRGWDLPTTYTITLPKLLELTKSLQVTHSWVSKDLIMKEILEGLDKDKRETYIQFVSTTKRKPPHGPLESGCFRWCKGKVYSNTGEVKNNSVSFLEKLGLDYVDFYYNNGELCVIASPNKEVQVKYVEKPLLVKSTSIENEKTEVYDLVGTFKNKKSLVLALNGVVVMSVSTGVTKAMFTYFKSLPAGSPLPITIPKRNSIKSEHVNWSSSNTKVTVTFNVINDRPMYPRLTSYTSK